MLLNMGTVGRRIKQIQKHQKYIDMYQNNAKMHQQKNIEINEGRKEGRNERRKERRKGAFFPVTDQQMREPEPDHCGLHCEIEMRCCKTLPRCPAKRPLQLPKEDSLGKLHDVCFLVVPSYIAGEALRPPLRPLPLLLCERRNSFGYSFLD